MKRKWKALTPIKTTAKIKGSLCYAAQLLCWKQIIVSKTLKSSQLNEELQVSCKSNYAIYLPEYVRPWDQTNLFLNWIEKVKPGFLLSLMCVFPELNGFKFWSNSFHLQNLAVLLTGMDQREDSMKMNFDNF